MISTRALPVMFIICLVLSLGCGMGPPVVSPLHTSFDHKPDVVLSQADGWRLVRSWTPVNRLADPKSCGLLKTLAYEVRGRRPRTLPTEHAAVWRNVSPTPSQHRARENI